MMVDMNEKKAIKKVAEVTKSQKEAAEDTKRTNEFVMKEWQKTSGSMISIQENFKKSMERQTKFAEQYKKVTEKDAVQNTSFLKEFLKNSKIAQSIQSQTAATMGAISGHISEVLGPFREMADFAKTTAKNIGAAFTNIGKDLGLIKTIDADKKQLEETKEQTTWLQKIHNALLVDEKKEFKEKLSSKEKPKGGIFEALAFGLGAIIGAIVGVVVLPFRLLLSGIKKIPGFRWMSKHVDDFAGIFARIGLFLERFRLLRPIIRGISKGFNTFVWPLQILLSLIDFVKGFMATEGTILDKIKGGVTVAIMKFLELPIRLFGFILDKILSIFGVEIEGGTTGYIVEIIKGTIGFIFDLFSSIFQGIYDLIKIFPWDAVKSVIQKVADVFLWPFKKLWDWIKDSKIIKYLASKFAGMDVSKEDPFATKSLVGGVKAKRLDLAKAVATSEVEAATGDLSRAQFNAIQRVKEQMKTSDENQKAFYKKLIDRITKGQEDAAKILIATATTNEGDNKEPVSRHDDYAIVLEATA